MAIKLTDESPMPFGVHKDKAMVNVPASYLLFLWRASYNNQVNLKSNVSVYIHENLEDLKQELKNNLMENVNSFNRLTKENFWNSVKHSCPKSMEKFCKWIDEYKVANNWENFFYHSDNDGQGESYTFKYHDVPLAMQLGIFIEFTCWYNFPFFEFLLHERPLAMVDRMTDFPNLISQWFKWVEIHKES